MTYKEALSVFGLNSINDKTPEILKKDYKKLIRYWHPDLNKSPQASQMTIAINEAYGIISQAIEKLSKAHIASTGNTVIISLEQLVEMYDTGSTANGKITSANMLYGRSFVSVDGEYIHNNIGRKFFEILRFKDNNTYRIELELIVPDLNTEEIVTIRILNKNVKLRVNNISAVMRLKFSDRILLDIEVHKEIIRDAAKA